MVILVMDDLTGSLNPHVFPNSGLEIFELMTRVED